MSNVHTAARTARSRKSDRATSSTPLEDLPLRENMRKPRYCFRRNQRRRYPLKRFLASRTGQKWNVIYSEICRQNSLHNYTQREIRTWIVDYVETAVVIEAGAPCTASGRQLSAGDFWVDPRDGILKVVPSEPRPVFQHRPDNYPNVRIDDTQRYVLVKGFWFLVTFAPLSAGTGAPRLWDVILRLPPNAERWRYTKEWRANVYARHKQQINGDQVKRLKKQGVLPT